MLGRGGFGLLKARVPAGGSPPPPPVSNAVKREDGSYELREDGSMIVRES